MAKQSGEASKMLDLSMDEWTSAWDEMGELLRATGPQASLPGSAECAPGYGAAVAPQIGDGLGHRMTQSWSPPTGSG